MAATGNDGELVPSESDTSEEASHPAAEKETIDDDNNMAAALINLQEEPEGALATPQPRATVREIYSVPHGQRGPSEAYATYKYPLKVEALSHGGSCRHCTGTLQLVIM